MTRGPLPPHERAWRHPSELAAPPHEPTSRVGYMLIASTATVGLLLVGILALSMTPDRLGAPEQSLAGSSEVVLTTSRASGVGPSTNGAPQSAADSVLRAVETLLAVSATQPNEMAAGIPVNPTNPTDTAATVSTLVAPETTAAAPAGVTPTDPTESPQPSTSTPRTSAAEPTSAEPVETVHESAFTTQAEPASSFPADELEPDLAGNMAFVPTESSEPPVVVELGASTSSSTSTGPGQSTTTTTTSTATTSTTSSTSSSTTVPATSSTLGFQVKQLGG